MTMSSATASTHQCVIAGSTLSPVPIRLYSLETALVRKHVFKVLNVISVPWKEQAREVNLLIGLVRW